MRRKSRETISETVHIKWMQTVMSLQSLISAASVLSLFGAPFLIYRVGLKGSNSQLLLQISSHDSAFQTERRNHHFFATQTHAHSRLLFYPIEKYRHQEKGFYRRLLAGRHSAVALGRMLLFPSLQKKQTLELHCRSSRRQWMGNRKCDCSNIISTEGYY